MSDIYLNGGEPLSEGTVAGELHAKQALTGDILGKSLGTPDTQWMYSNCAALLADAYSIASLVPDTSYVEDFGSALVGATLRRIMQDMPTDDAATAINVLTQGLDDCRPSFRDRSPDARAKNAAAKALKNLVIISNIVT